MGSNGTGKPKRKRTTVSGNLLKLAGVFVVFTMIALAARMVNREATLILPEMMNKAEDAALRASDDNALFLLREAQALLPAPEERIAPTLAEWRGRIEEHGWPRFTSELNRFIHFDDPALVAYIDACGTALDTANRAVRKPYFLLPEPDTYLTRESESFLNLGLALLVCGGWAGRVQGDAAEAMQWLTDAIRLSRLVLAEDANNLRARGIEDEALRQIILTAQDIHDAEELARIQLSLKEVGRPWPDPMLVLTRYWRKIDNTLSFIPSGADVGGGRRIRLMFFLREVQQWATSIDENKAFLMDLAAAPVAAHGRMLKEYGGNDSDWRSWRWRQEHRNAELLRKAAYTSLYFERAVVVVALERYRAAEGNYPDALDPLVPAFLDVLPTDPVSGAPLVYRVEGEQYSLYAVGTDGMDDGGSDEKDMWLVKP